MKGVIGVIFSALVQWECILKSKDLIRELQRSGWELVKVKGSHHQFKHPDKKGRVTVPHPKKDLPTGTVASIRKQAGL
jgi:predicted RNA binding protein YcfA (HicA-like mRNA interferase family)